MKKTEDENQNSLFDFLESNPDTNDRLFANKLDIVKLNYFQVLTNCTL